MEVWKSKLPSSSAQAAQRLRQLSSILYPVAWPFLQPNIPSESCSLSWWGVSAWLRVGWDPLFELVDVGELIGFLRGFVRAYSVCRLVLARWLVLVLLRRRGDD